MPSAAGIARFTASRRGDLLLAVVLAVTVFCYQQAAGIPASQRWTSAIFVLPWCASLAVRRRWPLPAAAVAALALFAVRPLGLDQALGGSLNILAWTLFLLAYALGTAAGWPVGLAGVALLTFALQVENQVFNPFFEMVTFGPWLAGTVVASRRRLTDQLQARNAELDTEREAFARESVRYERARIARDLHDIITHNVSLIVVQAGAGRVLAEKGSAQAGESLAFIAEAAREALEEVGHLVEFLASEPGTCNPTGLAMVDELVRRATAAGLAVTCRLVGDRDRLTPAISDSAYRVVQESLTNALKHAPGAAVDITIRVAEGHLDVHVINASPAQDTIGLARYGGGHGLAGMRQRVAAMGGSLEAGPTTGGGWRIAARLPLTSRAAGQET
jgi:signal transduction histidine kinase